MLSSLMVYQNLAGSGPVAGGTKSLGVSVLPSGASFNLGVNESRTFVGSALNGTAPFTYLWSLSPTGNFTLLVNGVTQEVSNTSTLKISDRNLTLVYPVAVSDQFVSVSVSVVDANGVSGKLTQAFIVADPYTSPGYKFDASTASASQIVTADGLGWFRVTKGLDGSVISSLTSTNPSATINGALALGGLTFIKNGAYAGASLVVPGTATLVAEPQVTGITYASIPNGARIDEPSFNAAFRGYSSGTYTIVTGSSAVTSGATWYLAFDSTNTVHWVSTNQTSVEVNSVNAGNGTIICNQVHFQNSTITIPIGVLVIEYYGGQSPLYWNNGGPITYGSRPNYVNRIDNISVTIGNFESAETWTKGSQGTSSADTTNFKTGTQGLKIVSWNTSSTYSTVLTQVKSFNLLNKVSTIWVYVDNVSNLGTLTFYLGNNASFNNFKFFVFPGTAFVAGWNHVSLPNSNSTSGNLNWVFSNWFESANLGSVGAEMVKLTSAYANVNVSVTLDAWVAVSPASNGVVTFSFDDGWATTATTVKPMFDNYDYKFVSAIITNYVGGSSPYVSGYMTWNQIQSLVDDGNDVVSHSINHPHMVTGGLTMAQIDYELYGSQQALAGNLTGDSKGERFFVQPFYEWNTTIQNEVMKYYSMASMSSGLYSSMPLGNIYDVQRCATNNATTSQQMIYMIQNATVFNSWIIFGMHFITSGDLTQSTYMTQTTLQTVLDYCNSNQVPVKTFSDVYDSYYT